MTRHLLTYLATLLAFGLLDYLWLGVIAKGWYREGMGELLAPQPNWSAAAAFYLLGALFGAFAYGTYNLTNLAVLRGWPLGLTALDLTWGTCVSAACAVAGALAWRATSG
jgi:uncharacterized membrane protein